VSDVAGTSTPYEPTTVRTCGAGVTGVRFRARATAHRGKQADGVALARHLTPWERAAAAGAGPGRDLIVMVVRVVDTLEGREAQA